MENQTPFRVLSWGCGLQSTTLAAMSALGELDPLDLIVHADTGWERQVTYDIRDWYTDWLRNEGMLVRIVRAGDIRLDGIQAHVHVPFWTESGGPLNRQCTRHFKVRPVKHLIREAVGYHRSKPPAPPRGAVELWLGISIDERIRAKSSRVQFITHRFPLLEIPMTRDDCTDWLEMRGLPIPPKSACVCCPYRRASEWIDIRDNAPEEWKAAVAFDRANRNNPLLGRDGSTADRLYLWRESIPLDEADLESAAARERTWYNLQLPMFVHEVANT